MTFNGNRLRVVRLFHDWTQRDLAEHVAVSSAAIGFYESGEMVPGASVLEALAEVLQVRPEFFERADTDEFREEQTFFRRRIAASVRQRKQVLARTTLFGSLVEYLRSEVEIPDLNIPSMTLGAGETTEDLADRLRAHWDMRLDAPIGNMSAVLENAGIMLLAVDLATAKRVDAFSRYGPTSVVVLSTEKGSTSRARFNMAHELAHAVLHRTPRWVGLDQREDEADEFAGAFLWPKSAFVRDMMGLRSGEWAYLFELKRHWGVSVQSMVVRAYQYGLIDAAEYRKRFRYMSGRGWRGLVGEPDEPLPDPPSLFPRLLDQFQHDTGKTVEQIAADLGWTTELFALVTGVEPPPIERPGVVSIAPFLSRAAPSETQTPKIV